MPILGIVSGRWGMPLNELKTNMIHSGFDICWKLRGTKLRSGWLL